MTEKEYLKHLSEIETCSNQLRKEVNRRYHQIVHCCMSLEDTTPYALGIQGDNIRFGGEGLEFFNIYSKTSIRVTKKNYLDLIPASKDLDRFLFLPFKDSIGYSNFKQCVKQRQKELEGKKEALVKALLEDLKEPFKYRGRLFTKTDCRYRKRQVPYGEVYNLVRVDKELRRKILS